ncbi:hypothetical protein JA1_001563 [Spathaspora sp. JA1]|nr:hypothetical protein JA1_001563 [Spathaspora sp. JA1]
MNVTSKGYYTSSYLNSQRNQKLVGPPRYDEYYSLDSPYEESYTDSIRNEPEMNSTASSKRTSSGSHRSIPPTSVSSPPRPPSRHTSGSSLTKSQMFVPDEEEPEEEEDPDRLEEEPTPAHLNYIAPHQYVPYRPTRRDPYQPHFPEQRQYRVSSGRVRPNKNGDYYINQQKRYDKAVDLKPKQYSHRTFKDVFVNKEEKLDRYNPMDLVFEGKAKTTNAGNSTFLKNVQTILKKDDYNDYNYYDHPREKKKKSPVKEVFVSEPEEDDDSDIEPIDQETFLNEEQRKMIKKNSNLRKAWKKKINKAKKELGRDFDKFAIKQNEIELELKQKREKEKAAKREAKEKEKAAKNEKKNEGHEEEKEKEEPTKEQQKFSPGWNYLLSLVKYDNKPEPKKESVKPAPKAKPDSPYAKNTQLINKKLKGFKKNSQVIFGNWNQPVAQVFSGELTTTKKSPAKSIKTKSVHTKSIHSSIHELDDGESKEFVIECDSDDDEGIVEELYYNPITKQLEPSPPTSSSAMEVDSDDLATIASSATGSTTSTKSPMVITYTRAIANRFLALDPSTPVEVVSNFVSLIKKIDIMKRVFAPIDAIGEWFPQSQTVVIFIELGIFMWVLFELSRLIDALCMMVKAFCAPMIAIGRFMNRVM